MNDASARDVRTERSGRRLLLAEELGRGAEGAVFAVRDKPELAVKLRLQGAILPDREAQRLRALIDLGLPEQPTSNPRLLCAWPRELVLNSTGQPVGFVMRRAPGEPVRLAALLAPRGREEVAPNLSFAVLSELAADIAALLDALSPLRIIVCDLNERGILLLRDGSVMLIDLDSVQFVDCGGVGYLSPLYTEEYLAPDLDPHQLNRQPRSIQHSDYTLAYLLFRVLMVGFEPYTGRRKDGLPNDLVQQSRDGAYAYSRRVSSLAPPLKAPSITVLSREIRELFEQTFVDGALDPKRRASAHKLEQTLRRQAQALVPCAGPRTHLSLEPSPCEWCRWERLVGFTPACNTPPARVVKPLKPKRAASPQPPSPRALGVPATSGHTATPHLTVTVAERLRATAAKIKASIGGHAAATRPPLPPPPSTANVDSLSRRLVLIVLVAVLSLVLLVKAASGATYPYSRQEAVRELAPHTVARQPEPCCRPLALP